jgi:hypothetical protein
VRIITAEQPDGEPIKYDKNKPPGIGAPYLRINYGALPDDVKDNIGPEPEIELEDDEEIAKTPPDLDLD